MGHLLSECFSVLWFLLKLLWISLPKIIVFFLTHWSAVRRHLYCTLAYFFYFFLFVARTAIKATNYPCIVWVFTPLVGVFFIFSAAKQRHIHLFQTWIKQHTLVSYLFLVKFKIDKYGRMSNGARRQTLPFQTFSSFSFGCRETMKDSWQET